MGPRVLAPLQASPIDACLRLPGAPSIVKLQLPAVTEPAASPNDLPHPHPLHQPASSPSHSHQHSPSQTRQATSPSPITSNLNLVRPGNCNHVSKIRFPSKSAQALELDLNLDLAQLRASNTWSRQSPLLALLTLTPDNHLLSRRPSLPGRVRPGSHLPRGNCYWNIGQGWHRPGC